MNAIWSDAVQLPQFEPLRSDRKTDVLVIGGGMAGILCAHQLQQAGVDCLLVEARTLCSGVSGHTTAKITSQHGLLYEKLLRKFNLEYAQLYLQANEEALEHYRSLCQNIDCEFEEQDSFVYSLEDNGSVERELSALQQIGYPAKFSKAPALPFPVIGAVQFQHQAQFHPLKFAAVVARNLPILEHTRVLAVKPGLAVTDHGTISAEHIIIATHFPFLNQHGSYFLKLYQHRSYVLAMEHGQNVQGMYIDASGSGLSLRNYGDWLLVGGSGHRTGKPSEAWQGLQKQAQQYGLPGTVTHQWATQDCMTLDGIPYIGPYSKHTPNLYVATGFNKWGMSSSMVAAILLTDLILGKENPYAPVFSPSRSILRPQLAINAGEAVLHLLTPKAPRCPHMGCSLKYNKQEHSWDCPCHGSRFTEDGHLLDNPAMKDANP